MKKAKKESNVKSSLTKELEFNIFIAVIFVIALIAVILTDSMEDDSKKVFAYFIAGVVVVDIILGVIKKIYVGEQNNSSANVSLVCPYHEYADGRTNYKYEVYAYSIDNYFDNTFDTSIFIRMKASMLYKRYFDKETAVFRVGFFTHPHDVNNAFAEGNSMYLYREHLCLGDNSMFFCDLSKLNIENIVDFIKNEHFLGLSVRVSDKKIENRDIPNPICKIFVFNEKDSRVIAITNEKAELLSGESFEEVRIGCGLIVEYQNNNFSRECYCSIECNVPHISTETYSMIFAAITKSPQMVFDYHAIKDQYDVKAHSFLPPNVLTHHNERYTIESDIRFVFPKNGMLYKFTKKQE